MTLRVVLHEIEAIKYKLIARAKLKGIYENFGLKEVDYLKNKYCYNPYGSSIERNIAKSIDDFDEWSSHFTL